MPQSWYRNIRKGAQGEYIAIIDLMERGFEVFRAADPAASTDLIIHKNGNYWRVQVKTGSPELAEITEGRQELVAWVSVERRTVQYDPAMPSIPKPMPKPDFKTLNGVAGAIEKALQGRRSVSWFATVHCENRSCDVRDVELHMKEFPNDPPAVRGPFVCPACGHPADLKRVRTTEQWDAEENRDARFRVNLQLAELRERARMDERGEPPYWPPLVNILEISDHDLPGWEDCESPLIE